MKVINLDSRRSTTQPPAAPLSGAASVPALEGQLHELFARAFERWFSAAVHGAADYLCPYMDEAPAVTRAALDLTRICKAEKDVSVKALQRALADIVARPDEAIDSASQDFDDDLALCVMDDLDVARKLMRVNIRSALNDLYSQSIAVFNGRCVVVDATLGGPIRSDLPRTERMVDVVLTQASLLGEGVQFKGELGGVDLRLVLLRDAQKILIDALRDAFAQANAVLTDIGVPEYSEKKRATRGGALGGAPPGPAFTGVYAGGEYARHAQAPMSPAAMPQVAAAPAYGHAPPAMGGMIYESAGAFWQGGGQPWPAHARADGLPPPMHLRHGQVGAPVMVPGGGGQFYPVFIPVPIEIQGKSKAEELPESEHVFPALDEVLKDLDPSAAPRAAKAGEEGAAEEAPAEGQIEGSLESPSISIEEVSIEASSEPSDAPAEEAVDEVAQGDDGEVVTDLPTGATDSPEQLAAHAEEPASAASILDEVQEAPAEIQAPEQASVPEVDVEPTVTEPASAPVAVEVESAPKAKAAQPTAPSAKAAPLLPPANPEFVEENMPRLRAAIPYGVKLTEAVLLDTLKQRVSLASMVMREYADDRALDTDSRALFESFERQMAHVAAVDVRFTLNPAHPVRMALDELAVYMTLPSLARFLPNGISGLYSKIQSYRPDPRDCTFARVPDNLVARMPAMALRNRVSRRNAAILLAQQEASMQLPKPLEVLEEFWHRCILKVGGILVMMHGDQSPEFGAWCAEADRMNVDPREAGDNAWLLESEFDQVMESLGVSRESRSNYAKLWKAAPERMAARQSLPKEQLLQRLIAPERWFVFGPGDLARAVSCKEGAIELRHILKSDRKRRITTDEFLAEFGGGKVTPTDAGDELVPLRRAARQLLPT